MKKLVYLAMVAFAASMVACGGNKAEENAEAAQEAPEAVEEAVVEEVVEVPCDSAAVDSAATVAE